ncbi:MAG: hypothetical protein CMJ46_14130 [Planctomyces sp.]|nr:hypothetical protein [Planctomyces sp.]
MFTNLQFRLFAVDIGEVITAVFLIITFLSWVFQAISSKQEKENERQGQNAKARAKRQQRQQQKESFESEIERFLKEVNNPDAKREPAREAARDAAPLSLEQERQRQREKDFADELRREQQQAPRRREPLVQKRSGRSARSLEEEFEIEIVDEPPQTPAERRRQRQLEKARVRQAAAQRQTPAPPIQAKQESLRERSLRERSLQKTELGSGVTSHVAQYMRPDPAQQAHFQSLGQGVISSVTSHLGQDDPGLKPEAAERRAAKVRALFNNKETIRQAILVNEILSKPKALR